MKNLVFKCIAVAMVLSFCTTGVMAQGFLKKLKKSVENVSSTVGLGSKDDTSSENAAADSISAEKLLNDVPAFTVHPVVEISSENGDTLRNEDGTVKMRYLVIDKDNKACDADVAKRMVNARLKSYGTILAKVGGGAVLGSATALLTGNKKDALKGAAIGAAAGLALSANNIKKIKELNKTLKEYKKTIEVYQDTFTVEGTPKDANVDLADVNGIDFTEHEVLSKTSAEIKDEIDKSTKLEDIDIDEVAA
ncbi:hypothetical protein [Phocaeicola sp.]